MHELLPEYFNSDLVKAVREYNLDKDDYLFRTGDRVSGIYFVISGEVKAVRHMAAESEAVMMRARDGEFFAESAIAANLYSCDGLAVKKTKLAFFSTNDLDKALGKAEFARAFFLANAANARRQCSRYERVRLRSARERVLHLLACERGPDGIFVWSAPLTELAVELALEPETLYRVLSDLETDGLITRQKRHFQLHS